MVPSLGTIFWCWNGKNVKCWLSNSQVEEFGGRHMAQGVPRRDGGRDERVERGSKAENSPTSCMCQPGRAALFVAYQTKGRGSKSYLLSIVHKREWAP